MTVRCDQLLKTCRKDFYQRLLLERLFMVEDYVVQRISNMNDNVDLSRLCKTEALYVPPPKKERTRSKCTLFWREEEYRCQTESNLSPLSEPKMLGSHGLLLCALVTAFLEIIEFQCSDSQLGKVCPMTKLEENPVADILWECAGAQLMRMCNLWEVL